MSHPKRDISNDLEWAWVTQPNMQWHEARAVSLRQLSLLLFFMPFFTPQSRSTTLLVVFAIGLICRMISDLESPCSYTRGMAKNAWSYTNSFVFIECKGVTDRRTDIQTDTLLIDELTELCVYPFHAARQKHWFYTPSCHVYPPFNGVCLSRIGLYLHNIFTHLMAA